MTFLKFFLLTLLLLVGFSAKHPHSLQAQSVGDYIQPLDLDILMNDITDEELVLLGEASHGTSEFYTWRAEISKRLITEKGYRFVAVEGDWPQFTRLNAYVKHLPGAPESIDEAFDELDRWPLWMWRNVEFRDFVEWLHQHNASLPLFDRVGLYGVDLYAKQKAMQDVQTWLGTIDSGLERQASNAYRCLTRYADIRQYLQSVAQSGEDCREDMIAVRDLILNIDDDLLFGDIEDDGDDEVFITIWDVFNATQNAELVISAEEHFRGNLSQGPQSWNARARHFMQTTSRLLEFYMDIYGQPEKGIVWAHNTHIGDARATDMGRHNMVNIGQLSRELLGHENVFAIGFGTYEGSVLAASGGEGQMETMPVSPPAEGTWEHLLANAAELDEFYLNFSDESLRSITSTMIPHRAIGVVFDPQMAERNNFPASIPAERYNAFIFIRTTDVLESIP
ncbi:MAG: erythromycin esterase family protein [Balneolales bacterium]|nr:erythromycin esterase family protein [Balneolales bacterium]